LKEWTVWTEWSSVSTSTESSTVITLPWKPSELLLDGVPNPEVCRMQRCRTSTSQIPRCRMHQRGESQCAELSKLWNRQIVNKLLG
jgi:hypothetical protein